MNPSQPIANMRITFWGVQGSTPIFPAPNGVREYSRQVATYALQRALADLAGRSVEEVLGGPATAEAIAAYQRRIGLPDLPFYSGETTCAAVQTSDGHTILLDAGTGLRRCSEELVGNWPDGAERVLHLFGTHEHLDHRAGLTFSRFCYSRPAFTVRMYGSYKFLHAIDQHYGIFSHETGATTYVDDPVDYTMMSAAFEGLELHAGSGTRPTWKRHWTVQEEPAPIRIGKATVTPFPVYHAMTQCLAYKIECRGKTFVFCTDHENRRGAKGDGRQQRSIAAEKALREHCRGADLAYFDGQYFLEEYLGQKGIGSNPPVKRIDWGHSCIEDAIERARVCGIRQTLIGHHDPDRSWQERVGIETMLEGLGGAGRVRLADSDVVVEL